MGGDRGNKKQCKSWCEEETLKLLSLRKQRLNVHEIAKAMGRPVSSIQGRMFRMGLSTANVKRLNGGLMATSRKGWGAEEAPKRRDFGVDYSTGQPQIVSR